MIAPRTHKIAPPRYKGTVRCQNYCCQAEYKPGKWCLVSSKGTSSDLEFIRSLPENSCPMCQKPVDNT
jgi:hypothetical protein